MSHGEFGVFPTRHNGLTLPVLLCLAMKVTPRVLFSVPIVRI